FSSRRRHTRSDRDWSSDVCSSDLRRSNPGKPGSGGKVTRVTLERTSSNRCKLLRRRHISGVVYSILYGTADREQSQIQDHSRFEIGRASCRERVEILVDGRSINKK